MGPKHWAGKYKNPLVELILNLYGHPDAGTLWERHAERELKKLGWKPISGWPSLFFQPETKSLLIVYGDDFKLACRADRQEAEWAAIRSVLKLDPPTPLDRFLGSYTRPFEVDIDKVLPILRLQPELLKLPYAY